MGYAEKLIAAMIRGVKDAGDIIFDISQRYVPVDRGTLKKSGTFTYLSDGITIAYRTPYAARIEFGLGPHDEFVRRHGVRRHQRRLGGHRAPLPPSRRGRLPARMYLRRGEGAPRGAAEMTGSRGGRYIVGYRMRGGRMVWVRQHQRGPYTRAVAGQVGAHYLGRAIDETLPQVPFIILERLRRAGVAQ